MCFFSILQMAGIVSLCHPHRRCTLKENQKNVADVYLSLSLHFAVEMSERKLTRREERKWNYTLQNKLHMLTHNMGWLKILIGSTSLDLYSEHTLYSLCIDIKWKRGYIIHTRRYDRFAAKLSDPFDQFIRMLLTFLIGDDVIILQKNDTNTCTYTICNPIHTQRRVIDMSCRGWHQNYDILEKQHSVTVDQMKLAIKRKWHLLSSQLYRDYMHRILCGARAHSSLTLPSVVAKLVLDCVFYRTLHK
jgi:hypothetical protein